MAAKKTRTAPTQRAGVPMSSILTSVNKKWGNGTIFWGSSLKPDIGRIPFGIFALDFSAGGGIPLWGSTCLWGPDCLSGDSVVTCTTLNSKGQRHSHKRVTIQRLYERFHGICGGKGKYPRKESVTVQYCVASVDADGFVFQNPILDVVYAGIKMLYHVTLTNGFALDSTLAHEYRREDGSFSQLGDLTYGDTILVHDGTRYTRQEYAYKVPRPCVMVKYHPNWPKKTVGDKYTYYRGRVSHAVMEAALNGLSYAKYISILNTADKSLIHTLKVIKSGWHVHHKDQNPSNNILSNLELMPSKLHNRYHALQNDQKLRYIAVPAEIIAIEPIGLQSAYDICCGYPNNNYIANGIVVHNSGGKTLGAIKAMRSAALICWKCFNPAAFCTCSQKALSMKTCWADVEGSLDQTWVSQCGVDPAAYSVALCDYGEQYADVADSVLGADDCGLLIIDSLASLVPEVEFDASASDQFMGNQAKLITRLVRRLKQRLIRERKREHPCAILFINQLRSKLGVMFQDPNTMCGGHALRHEFSLLFWCTKKSLKATKSDESSGEVASGNSAEKYMEASRNKARASRHSFAIRKEKILTLTGSGEFVVIKEDIPDLGLRKGTVDDFNALFTYAKEFEVVTKPTNNEYRYFGFKAKTIDEIKNVWRKKPEEYLRTELAIIRKAKKRLEYAVTEVK